MITEIQTKIPSTCQWMSMFHHVQKHGKCSNQQKLHLNDTVPFLINIIIYNLCQRSFTSIFRRIHAVLAQIHEVIQGSCMHPCTHLNLGDIDQNLFQTARYTVTCDAMIEKIEIDRVYGVHSLRPVPFLAPLKFSNFDITHP